MATQTQTGLSSHVRGVTVTTLACLAGVVAALASGFVVGTDPAAARNQLSLAILVVLVVVQFPIFSLVGVDVDEFGAKDYLYVVFMTFALWFITFGIILTSGIPL